jgi:hypothetical protein
MKFATKNVARRSVSLPSPPLPSLAALVLWCHPLVTLIDLVRSSSSSRSPSLSPQPNRSRLQSPESQALDLVHRPNGICKR